MIWKLFKGIGTFFWTIIVRFNEDRLTYSASALTFTSLLALVPLMAVCLAILSAFPVFHAVSQEVQELIFQNFIPTSGEVIQGYLQQFSGQAGQLSLVGTIFLFVTAVMMMLTIERSLNDIWKISRQRQMLSAVLRYWAVLSLAPVVIVVSIAVTSYVISLPFIVGTAQVLGLGAVLLKSTPFVLTMIVFTLIYYIIPNCFVPFRYAFSGAVVATVLFEIAKKLFVVYLKHFPTYHLIYGAFAILPVFLIWVYCLWVIILFGALVSNILTTYCFMNTTLELDGFTHAFLWLGQLWKAQQEGRSLSMRNLQKTVPGIYQVPADKQLHYLQHLHLIEGTDRHRYILSRDFSKMTLAQLYDLLPWHLPSEEESPLFPKKISLLFHQAHQDVMNTFNIPLDNIYEDLFNPN